MRADTEKNHSPYTSPVNLLEEIFLQFDWTYERMNETDIMAEVEGRWCTYRLFSMWRQDLESLTISCLVDIKVPQDKRDVVGLLLSGFNPKVWLGHFEVLPEDETPAFRYNLNLRGNAVATLEQVEEVVSSAVVECDRLYPALQFVLWGGKTPEEALLAAMLDTYGEA